MKVCDSCGQGNTDDAAFCNRCGAKLATGGPALTEPAGITPPTGTYQLQPYVQVVAQQTTDGMCLVSMVLGIVSIWMYPLGIVLGPLAIYFAKQGNNNLLADPHLKGASFATAGRVCGIIGTVISSIVVVSLIIFTIVVIVSH
jgi:hypothetical protein